MTLRTITNAKVAARLAPCDDCGAEPNELCRTLDGSGHTTRVDSKRGRRWT